MNDRKKLKWPSLALAAVFALAGCGQANARNTKSDQPTPAVAALGDTGAQPSAQADADNGPGCAESAVVGSAQQKSKKALAGK
jgi:hypothetical protein